MNQISQFTINNYLIIIYNSVLLLSLIYLLYKFNKNSLYVLIILIFFSGLASDISLVINNKMFFNIYKIFLLIYSFFLFIKNYNISFIFKNSFINIVIFSLYFTTISLFIHKDNFLLVFSQLSNYIIPLFTLISMYLYVLKSKYNIIKLNRLFEILIALQIVFSFTKLIIVKGYLEGWVGSITGLFGGGAGTSLPLLGLCWIAINSNMKMSKKNFLYLIGLLFIGFMAGKRAIWFMFPTFYILFYFILKNKSNFIDIINRSIPIIILGFIFLYMGLRLNPTLNPDNKVWGQFDLDYAYNYVLKYSTGIESESDKLEEGQGRVGAVFLLWNELKDIGSVSRVSIGVGNEYMIYANIDDYSNSDYYFGISYRGGITGIVMMYFTIGIIGVILFINYLFSLLTLIKYKKLFYLITLTVLFDYILYNSQIIKNTSLFIFLMFIIILSNSNYNKQGEYKMYIKNKII